jgi:MFS family permease
MGTYGTQDITTWMGFAEGVSQRGPVGVYGINFGDIHGTVYNHPPLVGYYLEVLNKLSQWGAPLMVTIRAVSSATDVISGLLIFEILRRRRSLLLSTISGIAVGASPVLFLVSGYHGNTDPLFLMLVLLGSFLIIDKRMALLGGVALGLAIGIKLVPIVVLPTIIVYIGRHRRDLLVRTAAGFGVTFALTWGPAILTEWNGLHRNVLGYAGINDRPWGLVRFADGLGWSWASQFLIGPGRYIVLLLCALIPATLTWRRRRLAMESVAMSLVAFLALSPAFGVQYLAWAAAATYLLDFWFAALYNLLGGLFLFQIYTYWNGGLPWLQMAKGQLFTPYEVVLAALLWALLIAVLMRGTHRALSGGSPPALQRTASQPDPALRST